MYYCIFLFLLLYPMKKLYFFQQYIYLFQLQMTKINLFVFDYMLLLLILLLVQDERILLHLKNSCYLKFIHFDYHYSYLWPEQALLVVESLF